jgi:hypothetical protein
MDAVTQFVQEVAKEGCVMVQSGGLYPTSDGARVRLAGGKVTVTDGPFTEAKEVVGGYAIFDVPSKAHMIRVTERFMALHKTLMPGWEGECELRQMAAPGEPEPCGQTQKAEAAV